MSNGKIKKLRAPFDGSAIEDLHAGDVVSLSGTIYGARDAAHARMMVDYAQTGQYPFDLRGQTIFYMGPCPARPGEIIGAAGPTTSHRMDAYTPQLLAHGLSGMIGKGKRSQQVIEAMVTNHAVYFVCVGGTGALCASCVTASEVIAYDDLGTEAVRRLDVVDLPLIVAIDARGETLFGA